MMRDYADQIARLRECASNSHEIHLKCGAYLSGVCAKTRDIRMQDAADAIEELLDELTTIRKQFPRWTSVEDELPSRYETVLLNIQTCKDSYVTIGDYEPNELRFRDFADRNNQVYCGDIVTHWMPLPEPPKGGIKQNVG